MENIEIVKLKPSDWEVYRTIRLEELKEDPLAFGSSYEKEITFSDEEWKERPANKNSMIFVAKDGATPIGLVGILLKPENDEEIGHIWGMYVNHTYRGIGVGKRLMERALGDVKKLSKVKKVQLRVNYEPTPAQMLYKSLGFHSIGTTEYPFSDGKDHTIYIMEKIL